MIDLSTLTLVGGINILVGFFIKILMALLVVFSLLMVRQDQLMDRVLNIPFGRNLKVMIWSYFVLTVILTAIVILVA